MLASKIGLKCLDLFGVSPNEWARAVGYSNLAHAISELVTRDTRLEGTRLSSRVSMTSVQLCDQIQQIAYGDVADFTNFMGAVIDEAAFTSISGYIDYAKHSDDAEIIADGTLDSDGNGFLDECDCNDNGIDDDDEIANGAPDSNGDGLMDECDCNNNGIPDDEDIANETSEDCNDNGVPDECECVDENDNGVATTPPYVNSKVLDFSRYKIMKSPIFGEFH